MKKLLLFILFINNSIYSQNFIFDSINKTPINSVSIIYNNNQGVITNDDGYFELPKKQDIDSLIISHISYNSKKTSFNSLKLNDTIFLIPSIINLNEIVINNFKVKDTVIKAIGKIRKNYLDIPYNSYGFFRQTLEENSKGVEMIEVDFKSYAKKNTTTTKIITAKRTNNYSEFGMETYGAVTKVIKDGDFIRRESYFFDIEKIDNYQYKYEGQINHENLNVYKISFKPKDENNLNFIRKGFFYIDSESFAIVELKYSFDKKKLAKIINSSKKKQSNKKAFYILIDVENIIKYRKTLNEKWSLSFIKAVNYRKGVLRKRENLYKQTAKLVINNISTNNVISFKDNYKLSKDFSEAVKKYDNLEKWGNTYKFPLSNREKTILKNIKNENK
jgi:hypothetical protein